MDCLNDVQRMRHWSFPNEAIKFFRQTDRQKFVMIELNFTIAGKKSISGKWRNLSK